MAEANLGSRIEGIRQLGSVVRAMTGIAGARARMALGQIAAVDSFAETLRAAWQQVTATLPEDDDAPAMRPALIVFCAEQGFVGAFSERVLDTLGDIAEVDVFLIGSRGATIALQRGINPIWSTALPSRSASLPKFADQVLGRVYAANPLRAVDVVYPNWQDNQVVVIRRVLSPIKADKGSAPQPPPPLTNLAPAKLLVSLGRDLVHADLTRAALHAFVAENEARMLAMSNASRQIDEELAALEAIARRDRQEAITAEIIEISSGARSSKEQDPAHLAARTRGR